MSANTEETPDVVPETPPEPVSEEGNADANTDANATNEEAEGTMPELEFLQNLCILPPRQKSNVSVSDEQLAKDAILLPPLLPNEPVSAIRAAISEIKGYAHLTSYRLVVEDLEDRVIDLIIDETRAKQKAQEENVAAAAEKSKAVASTTTNVNVAAGGKKKKKKGGNGNSNGNASNSKGVGNTDATTVTNTIATADVVSAYTTGNSCIEVSATNLPDEECSDIVLNDYEDLSLMVEEGLLRSNMGLRIVLERYNVGTVKDHLEKTRFLLEGNTPCAFGVTGALMGNEEEIRENEGDGADTEVKTSEQTDSESGKKEEEGAEEKKDDADEAELKLPETPVDVDTSKLVDFFRLACGEGEEKDKVASTNNLKGEFQQLDDRCHVKCDISFGGFNPPPAQRQLLGDLAYLEVVLPGAETPIHLTVIPTGFYVNKTSCSGGVMKFNASPATEPCFSHELLDCLLLRSKSLRGAWAVALAAATERSDLTSRDENPLRAVLRASVDGGQQTLDSVTIRPSWLVPTPKTDGDEHDYNLTRLENDLSDCYGLDLRSGATRDWNEEFQSAREMPKDDINERIERARVIHKVLCDFGDASVIGVMAISKGQISPMNPNENSRSHVYLHNNIFFSRAVDSGVDTFKLCGGDKSAKKSASRDAQCVGKVHQLDVDGINTLATVLVDYLGSRFVCQSIVPGILLGEKTHKILYGAVEAASSLSWDKDLHDKLEGSIGKAYMIATRKVLTLPLTDERLEIVKSMRMIPETNVSEDSKADEEEEQKNTTDFFGSVEMKGIQGSDLRSYCLDVTRLTPRDANWVPESEGGTGNFEALSSKSKKVIPTSLDDEELVMAVLRPELVLRFTQQEMRKHVEDRKKKDLLKKDGNKEDGDGDKNEKAEDEKATEDERTKEDLALLDSLRLNLNIFLPHLKSIEDIDKDAFEQLKIDEILGRKVASYLWDTVLPQLTAEARDRASQLPFDGRHLTEWLHERGVNCRYLGRLATLAVEEEEKDAKDEKDILTQKSKTIATKTISKSWLELLECEMVARAAKHVLDEYLLEAGGIAASQPSRIIAAFLSALMSTSEESAADTERRLAKHGDDGGDEQLTLLDVCVDGFRIRGHDEVWTDITKEIGRRFRYKLRLYNNKDPKVSSRASLVPLLRRVCQRTGVRVFAKNYNMGSKGLCNMVGSYPIASADIVAIVPMVKHAASVKPEFVPCANGAVTANASLYIMLPDAKNAVESATIRLSQSNVNPSHLNQALELSQEATNLYQRVTDSPLHASISKSLDLTTLILFNAGEMNIAASHASKALAISIQLGGFDSAHVVQSSMTLFQIFLGSTRLASAIKQLRSMVYLVELLAGPHHAELMNLYYRMGQIYAETGNVAHALHYYQASQKRQGNDRVFHGLISKQSAAICAKLGDFATALELEKIAFNLFGMTLGGDHDYTKNSGLTLQRFVAAAVEHDKQKKANQKKQMEEAEADAIGEEIIAKEMAEVAKKKKKKNKSKSKKKK